MSNELKFGDLVIINGSINPFSTSEEDEDYSRHNKQIDSDAHNQTLGDSGFLSAIGFTDNRVFIQAVPPNTTDSLQVAANWANYQDLVFQVWPKANCEAHKQLKKFKKERRLIEGHDEESKKAYRERLVKLEHRVQGEIESNKRLLHQFMGQPILYGTEIQLMHMNSESFLTAKVACSDSDKSAYKFDLSKEFSTGMTFKFLPRYMIRQEGEPVQLEDEVLIYSLKLDCYMNFSNNQLIEIDRKNDSSNRGSTITSPYELRQLAKGSYRYEAHISQFKDCVWKIYYYGQHREESQTLRGGDLLRLKHSELGFYLASDIQSLGGLNKVYGRTYTGEFDEEANNINSVWEVECEDSTERGKSCVSKDEEGKPKSIKLRHFLTGRLLSIDAESFSGQSRKILALSKGETDSLKKGTSVIFSSFASNVSDNAVHYNTAYGLGVSDDKSSYKYVTGIAVREKNENREEVNHGGHSGGDFQVFKPLDESEFNVKKRNVFCDNNEPRAEHAFILIRVEEEERSNLFLTASSTHMLKYFRDILKTATNPHEVNHDMLIKVKNVLKDLIIFVHKEEEGDNEEEEKKDHDDEIEEYEGITVDSKQRLLKDFKIIELLTEILYYPFEQKLFTIDNINDPQFRRIFAFCYRLIKHIIKEYRPNEIYASQWLEHYMNQAMKSIDLYDIKAEATLIELIDNNKRILDTKIDKDIISKFVIMLKENKNDKFINLLRALCVCDGKAVTKNQADMSHLIIEDEEIRSKLIYQNFKLNRGAIEVRVKDYERNGEYWVTIPKFEEDSKSLDDGETYNYFLSMIYFLSDLCLERNYIAIDYLDKIYSYDICYSIVSDNTLSNEVRSAFAKLLTNLWIDRKPYQEYNFPQYLILWDEISPEACAEIRSNSSHADYFNVLKGFLKNHFGKLSKNDCTKIYETETNKFTSVLLELTTKLVKFGLYKTVNELKDLMKPLLVLLNGMKDAMTKREFEKFQKLKDGGKKASRKSILVKSGGNNVEKQADRYKESEETLIVMNCKNQICELVKTVMHIADDLNLRKYLLEFKNDLEAHQREQEQSDAAANSNVRLFSNSGVQGTVSRAKVVPEKKSLFSNFKLFDANEEQGPEVDVGQLSFAWIKRITDENPLDLKNLAPTNFVRMLFDLSMYEHDELVNNSFNILYDTHSNRDRLKEMLEQVQIMEDQEKKQAVDSIKDDIYILKDHSETMENWFGKNNANSQEILKQTISVMKKLGNYLYDESGNMRAISREPDAEIISSQYKNRDDDEAQDEEQTINAEFQQIFRHLRLHKSLLEFLDYEISTGENNNNQEKINLLKETIKLLTKFIQNDKTNQSLVEDHLETFAAIMKRYPRIGAERLIEEIFKGSKALLRQSEKVEKFAKSILAMISEIKPNDNKRARLLMMLESLMIHKKQAIKANQTVLLSLLTYRENINLYITAYTDKTKKTMLENLFNDYNRQVAGFDGNAIAEIPSEIDYVNAMLEIMAFACYGKNAVTESKSQSSWPLENLAHYYEKAGQCWLAKKAALMFFYHVYLDTERENKEEKEHISNMFQLMAKDIKFICENYRSQYTIKYCKGAIDNKTTQEQFLFDAFLPSMTDILAKEYFKNLNNRKEGLKSMLESISRMEQLVSNRQQKKDIRACILKFKIHANEVFEEFDGTVGRALPATPDLSRNGSSTKKGSTIVNEKTENAKMLKLKTRLELLGTREEFQDCIEQEFEDMIKILLRVEKEIKGDIYSTPLSFNGVMKSLINLVDIKDPTLEKKLSLIGLKMFRKIIEKENKEQSTDEAAEWEGDQWVAYKKQIVDRQNQLCKLGMVEVVGNILSYTKDLELIHEAVLLGIALLFGGNHRVQKEFLQYIQNDIHNKFLNGLKKCIDKNFDIIKKEMSRKNRHYAEELIAKDKKAAELAAKKNAFEKLSADRKGSMDSPLLDNSPDLDYVPVEDEVEMDDEDIVDLDKPVAEDAEETQLCLKLLKRSYRFLQLFCEGHNLALQDILRVQTYENGVVNGKSQDFISQTAYNFNTLLKQINIDCLDVVVQMLDFLIESLQGPCRGNQTALAKAKIINSCIDYLTMFSKPIDYQKRGFVEPDQVAQANDGTTTAMKVLNSLIEGNSDPEITEEMGAIDFTFLVDKLSQEYATWVREVIKADPEKIKPADVKDKCRADSFNQQILESFDIYILLISLSDNNEKVASFLKDQEDFTKLNTYALQFFNLNTGSIEILFEEKLIKIYFPIHTVCHYLTKNSRQNLMTTVNRDSPNEKIGGLVNAAPELFDEMDHMAWLKKQIFEFTQFRYNMLRDLSTLLALFINVIMICTYIYVVWDDETHKIIREMGSLNTESFINALGYVQIGTSSLMIVFWVIINTPMILRRRWRELVSSHKAEPENDALTNLEDEPNLSELPLDVVLELLFRRGPFDPIFNKNGQRDFGHIFVLIAYQWRNATFIMSEGRFIFMLFYFLVSVLGIALSEITYCLHLLDIINRSDILRNVIRSVTHNIWQLLSTAMLGGIIIYIYTVIGFFFLDGSYFNGDMGPNGERSCTSMIHCFMTTVNYGLRNGGGIGESLDFVSYEPETRGRYIFRLIFDLSFFIIINIVFLNIIFGIIIDTFAELRDKKREMDEDMKTVCYICNLDRYTFDKNGTGFENHIEKNHHLWNYLYFIYSIRVKDSTEYNGIESYIHKKIESEDISWFPLHHAIELGGAESSE